MIKKVSESYKHNILSIALGPFIKIIEAFFDLLIPLFMKAIIDLNQYGNPDSIPNKISSSIASFIRVFNNPSNTVSDALVGGLIILIMGIVGYVLTMISQYIAAVASVSVPRHKRNGSCR